MTNWTHDPACAKDDALRVVWTEDSVDGLFTRGLASSIYTKGPGWLIDTVWRTLLSIKDKIGAYL
jgi:hypothetical protein